MPIQYKKGNAVTALIDGEINLLLNCVNCQGKYASGIAKEIRQRIPTAYDDYLEFYNLHQGSMLGEFYWHMGRVVHIAAQEFYGYDNKRYVNYAALAKALDGLSNQILLTYKIGIPYGMCAGLAGGDWTIVLEMIEFYLNDFDVIIYTLEDKL